MENKRGEKVSGKSVGRRGGLHVIYLKVTMNVAYSKCRKNRRMKICYLSFESNNKKVVFSVVF